MARADARPAIDANATVTVGIGPRQAGEIGRFPQKKCRDLTPGVALHRYLPQSAQRTFG